MVQRSVSTWFLVMMVTFIWGTIGSLFAVAVQAAQPAVDAEAAVLMDAVTGRVLYARNAHELMMPASITKIMTAAIAIEHGQLDDLVEITSEASLTEGSKLHIRPGDPYTLEELIYGLMLVSGNDAGVAIAQHISGSVADFAALMNETARNLGARNTHFVNPHGLPDTGHLTTAYDMALITRYALSLPKFREISGTRVYDLEYRPGRPARQIWSGNDLLGVGGVDGGKTGYTIAARHTYVGTAMRDGNRLIAAVLKTHKEGKWQDAMALFDYGYGTYEWEPIAREGEARWELPVAGGMVNTVAVAARSDLAVPLLPNEKGDLRVEERMVTALTAPVEEGAVVGQLLVYLGNAAEPLATVDLLTIASVARRPTFWERFRANFGALLSGRLAADA